MSALVITQGDHTACIMVLASASTAHLQRLRQHQLHIEDSENRSLINNIRLQGILEEYKKEGAPGSRCPGKGLL